MMDEADALMAAADAHPDLVAASYIRTLKQQNADLERQVAELTEQRDKAEYKLAAERSRADSWRNEEQRTAEQLRRCDEQLAARDALVERLREALLEVAGCEQCDRAVLGVWEWGDEDGEERVCDEHKNSHFYVRGPFLNDKLRSASEALCRAALADGQAQAPTEGGPGPA